MKRITKVFLWLCIIFLVALSIFFLTEHIRSLSFSCRWLMQYKDMLKRKLDNPESVGNTVEEIRLWIVEMQSSIIQQSFGLVIGFLALAACAFLFVYCNPRLFRRSTWTNLSEEWEKNKQERAAARAEKAEADKQKQIAELEQKLDELKKD